MDRSLQLPSWFEEEPPLFPEEFFYLRAFNELSTERQLGWGIGPIPNSRMREWGEREGLQPTTMRIFLSVLSAMDVAYIEHMGDERKKELENGKNKRSSAKKK